VSEVLQFLREAEPALANVPDADLIRFAGESMPELLKADVGFRQEFSDASNPLTPLPTLDKFQPSDDKIEQAKELQAKQGSWSDWLSPQPGILSKEDYKAEAEKQGVEVLGSGFSREPLLKMAEDTKKTIADLGMSASAIGIFSRALSRAGVDAPEKLSVGGYKSAADFIEAMTTPENIALLGLGGAPGAVQKTALTYFFGEMGSQIPAQAGEVVRAAGEASVTGDLEPVGRAATGLGLTAGMTGLLGAHVAKAPASVNAVKSAEAVLKEVAKVEEPKVEAKPAEVSTVAETVKASETPKVSEPWEMTKAEFVEKYRNVDEELVPVKGWTKESRELSSKNIQSGAAKETVLTGESWYKMPQEQRKATAIERLRLLPDVPRNEANLIADVASILPDRFWQGEISVTVGGEHPRLGSAGARAAFGSMVRDAGGLRPFNPTVDFYKPTVDVIALFNSRNPTDFFHEVGHRWQRKLLSQDHSVKAREIYEASEQYKKWQAASDAGDKRGTYKYSYEEWFSNRFHDYLLARARKDVSAFPQRLREVFGEFRNLLATIWHRVRGSASKSMRDLLDESFGFEGKQTISSAPTGLDWFAKASESFLADRHRFHVEEALRKGEKVPDTVLADYPELSKMEAVGAAAPDTVAGQIDAATTKPAPPIDNIAELRRRNPDKAAVTAEFSAWTKKKTGKEAVKIPNAERRKLFAEFAKEKVSEPAAVTQEFTGPGGRGISEPTEPTKGTFVPKSEIQKKEWRVKLAEEYNLDKLQEQFDLFNSEIGDALTTGGQFLVKDMRPQVAKGAPAEKGTSTSKSINQYFVNKLVTLKDEFGKAKDMVRRDASPEYVEYFNLIEERFMHAFRQVQELRRASHESLYFWNSVKGEMIDLSAAIGHMADIKPRIPILDKLWKDLRDKNFKDAAKDIVEYMRINLFTIMSWSLDFGTNMAVVAARVPAWAVLDTSSFVTGKPAHKMASALRAIRLNARNVIPFAEKFRLPGEIEVKLGTTIGGELRGFGKEIMVDFSEILRTRPEAAKKLKEVDRIIAAPVRMKRAVDNMFGRLGATTTLYDMARSEGKRIGLKGDELATFIDNYVKAPPREAVDKAVKVGNEFKFNRDLTQLEEKFAGSILTKTLVDAYPRWGFQFTRWAGEMLGANPDVIRKIKNKTATKSDVIEALAKAATGWGGIYMFSQTMYDNIDANSMEYVLEDGDRVRLSGRTPLPELFFATALIRGDWLKAKAALPYISIPGARLLGGEPGGVFSPIVDTVRESMRGRYTAEQTTKELTRMLNDAIPGKSTLGVIRSAMDPTVREGFGAPIPFLSSTLPQKVNPTTGEPMTPKQRLPGTSIVVPTVGGTPFPGAVRDLNEIEATLLNHGIGLFRPRRTSLIELPPEEVPPEFRREYEKLAGSHVKELLGELISSKDFQEAPFEIRKEALSKMLTAARSLARLELAEKYDKSPLPVKTETIQQQLLPERLKQPRMDVE
jgi:hypothetical protein